MGELSQEIARTAANAVTMCESCDGSRLDYWEASLAIVEDTLAEVAKYAADMTPDQINMLVQDFGSNILEVASRQFGGRYAWFDERDQPVLVVGEPAFRIALLAWDRVRERLAGDAADSIQFFYA